MAHDGFITAERAAKRAINEDGHIYVWMFAHAPMRQVTQQVHVHAESQSTEGFTEAYLYAIYATEHQSLIVGSFAHNL